MNKQLSYKAIEYFFRYGETNTKIPLQYTSEINYQKCPLYRLHFSGTFSAIKNLLCGTQMNLVSESLSMPVFSETLISFTLMKETLTLTLSRFWSCPRTITRLTNRCICLKKSIMNSSFLTPNNTKFLSPLVKSFPQSILCLKYFLSFKFYTRTKLTKNHLTKTEPQKNSLSKLVQTILWSFPTIFLLEGIIANLCSTIQIHNATKKAHRTGN